jgi:HSP20 family protein
MIVPGFTKEQVKISIENNILSVKIEQAKSEQKYMKHEFDLHQAQRKFKLPLLIDQSSIEAQLELGILKIKLTKKKDNHYSQEIKID